MMKNTFYFKSKALLEIFTFLSRFFDYIEKRVDKKATVNFKIYDVTGWATNNYNTQLASISRNKRNQTQIWSINKR